MKNSSLRKAIVLTVVVTFVFSLVTPASKAQAQGLLGLPEPGTMVSLSPAYEPALIKGLTVHKDNPFLFDFIVDTGHSQLAGNALKAEGDRLIKYFFAALTIPDRDVWVNLSPYEKDRMIPQALGQTAMGRDLLAQDYMLKQLTASLIYPEKELGRNFWDKIYTQAREQFGTTDIPVNTFNKVWIVAEKASVYEHNQTAFIVNAHLKVMLEEDYLSLQKHNPGVIPAKAGIHSLSSQIIRSIILPALEQEVNQGQNFARLRQIFYSQILAVWFKRNLKQALLAQVYADKSTVNGVNLKDPSVKELIYQRYLKAYKKGVFNYIKEDVFPPIDGEGKGGVVIPRKYFSGGYDSEQLAITPAKFYEARAAADQTGRTVDFAAVVNTNNDRTALEKIIYNGIEGSKGIGRVRWRKFKNVGGVGLTAVHEDTGIERIRYSHRVTEQEQEKEKYKINDSEMTLSWDRHGRLSVDGQDDTKENTHISVEVDQYPFVNLIRDNSGSVRVYLTDEAVTKLNKAGFVGHGLKIKSADAAMIADLNKTLVGQFMLSYRDRNNDRRVVDNFDGSYSRVIWRSNVLTITLTHNPTEGTWEIRYEHSSEHKNIEMWRKTVTLKWDGKSLTDYHNPPLILKRDPFINILKTENGPIQILLSREVNDTEFFEGFNQNSFNIKIIPVPLGIPDLNNTIMGRLILKGFGRDDVKIRITKNDDNSFSRVLWDDGAVKIVARYNIQAGSWKIEYVRNVGHGVLDNSVLELSWDGNRWLNVKGHNFSMNLRLAKDPFINLKRLEKGGWNIILSKEARDKLIQGGINKKIVNINGLKIVPSDAAMAQPRDVLKGIADKLKGPVFETYGGEHALLVLFESTNKEDRDKAIPFANRILGAVDVKEYAFPVEARKGEMPRREDGKMVYQLIVLPKYNESANKTPDMNLVVALRKSFKEVTGISVPNQSPVPLDAAMFSKPRPIKKTMFGKVKLPGLWFTRFKRQEISIVIKNFLGDIFNKKYKTDTFSKNIILRGTTIYPESDEPDNTFMRWLATQTPEEWGFFYIQGIWRINSDSIGLLEKLLFRYQEQLDNMASDRATLAKAPKVFNRGGIDLNMMNAGLSVSKDANGGVVITVDPAMIERVRREGITNATPVIINMKVLASVNELLGL